MFLYLDDVRIPLNSKFYVVRTYDECVSMIKNNQIDLLSLDHDLGDEKTGYDIAKFIVQEGIYIPHINIHSANPVGRDNIKQLISRYFPQTKLTYETKI